MWNLHGMGERNFVQMVQVTCPRWPPWPYMVKTFKTLLLWNQVTNDLETWCTAWGYLNTNRFIQMMTLCLLQGHICFLKLFLWEKAHKYIDFSDTIKVLDINSHQGGWTLSMISYRSVKMTSNYPTSCFEVRRKQKVIKPIFKGCPRKNVCKYQHLNHIVFSCNTCLQKEKCLSDNYAIIVRYSVYKAWS